MARTSNIEKRARDDLNTIFGGCVEHHPKINHCVFNTDCNHVPDFYLPEFDLYIEVKGYMTLFAVNKMQYLFKLLKGRFYVLQMTEESWISGARESECIRENSIVEDNYQTQLKELCWLTKTGIKNAVAELSKRSQKRLKRYVRLRMKDAPTWAESYRAKFGRRISSLSSTVLRSKCK